MKKILILILSLSIFSFSLADWTSVIEPLEGFGLVRFNREEESFALLYDSRSKDVGVYLMAKNQPSIDGSPHMTIVVDNGAVRKYTLTHSKRHEYEAFLSKKDEAILVKDMKNGQKITIKIEGTSDTLVVEYPLEGFNEKYDKVSESLK